MRRPAHHTRKRRQRGIALMLMLAIMIMGIAAVLIGSLTTAAVKNARQQTTSDALAQAKDALIGYAITYGDTHANQVHGYLPCPDIDASNGEGGTKLSCNGKNVSTIGRLPWKTLGLGTLLDGDGECLWYAVSGTYKYNTKTDLMNWDTPGLFEILDANGNVSTQDVVAAVFAPGMALGSQNRAPDGTAPICGGNYTVANYLDSDAAIGANNSTPSTAANAISQFAVATPNINDRILFITRNDIFNALKKRNDFGPFISTLLTTATACGLSPVTVDFNSSPPIDMPGSTVGGLTIGRVPASCLAPPLSNWRDNLLYARCNPEGNCLTVNGLNCRGLVIFSGERNSSQTRMTNTDKNTWSNYLEDSPSANLTAFTTGGLSFAGVTSYSITASSTDILACIP